MSEPRSVIDMLFSGGNIASASFGPHSSGMGRVLARAMSMGPETHMEGHVCGEISVTPHEYRDWLLYRDSARAGMEPDLMSYWDEVRSVFRGRRVLYVYACGRLRVWSVPGMDQYAAVVFGPHSRLDLPSQPAFGSVREARLAAQEQFPEAIPLPEGFWKRALRHMQAEYNRKRVRPLFSHGSKLSAAVHGDVLRAVYLLMRQRMPNELVLAEMM